MAEASAEEPKIDESDAKTVQDVLKMSGKVKLKFGVLIGLIKVDQVPNRDVVDTVLNLVRIRFATSRVLCFCRFGVNCTCVGLSRVLPVTPTTDAGYLLCIRFDSYLAWNRRRHLIKGRGLCGVLLRVLPGYLKDHSAVL